MTKFKYTATSSNGVVATRTSERDYGVAVFARGISSGNVVSLGFSRDERTARSSFAAYAKYGDGVTCGWVDFEFVPTTRVEVKSRAKKAEA